MTKALIVDDDSGVIAAARLLLRREGFSVETLHDPESLPAAISIHEPDVVLLDLNFSVGERSCQTGLDWIERLHLEQPTLSVVAITAHAGLSVALEAMKRGATDFIAKPWANEKFVATIRSAAALTEARREADNLRIRNQGLGQTFAAQGPTMIGSSKAMQKVYNLVARVAPTEANILISGESGTGKELLARDIHRQSARKDQIFLPTAVGEFPETETEIELFGIAGGSGEGEASRKIGRLEMASGGTLFLDEIGNIPGHIQPRLYCALEDEAVLPIGDSRPSAIDTRVISSTSLMLSELSDEKVFRQDLLYHLKTVEIVVPPLRERREDIPQLVDFFLSRYARKKGQERRRISGASLEALSGYEWPGNVRALFQSVERALVLSNGELLEPSDFLLEPSQRRSDGTANGEPGPRDLETIERLAIANALKRHSANISRTARELGISRASLYRRMEKHDLG